MCYAMRAQFHDCTVVKMYYLQSSKMFRYNKSTGFFSIHLMLYHQDCELESRSRRGVLDTT